MTPNGARTYGAQLGTSDARRRFRRAAALAALLLVLSSLALHSPALATVRKARMSGVTNPTLNYLVMSLNRLRRQYHLPVAHLTHAYDAVVRAASLAKRDPVLPPLNSAVLEKFGIWGITAYDPPPAWRASSSILDSWVFEDGWDGARTTNIDCSTPRAQGCNAHRRAVLSAAPMPGAKLYIDVAVQQVRDAGGAGTSIAALLVWRRA